MAMANRRLRQDVCWQCHREECRCSGLRTGKLRLAHKDMCGAPLGAKTWVFGPTFRTNEPTRWCTRLAHRPAGQRVAVCKPPSSCAHAAPPQKEGMAFLGPDDIRRACTLPLSPRPSL